MAPHPLRTSEEGNGAPASSGPRFPAHAAGLDQFGFPLNLFCGFAPFAAYVVMSRLSISLALWAAFAAAFALGLPAFLHTRTIRTLDGGGIALFGLAAFLSGFLRALSDFNTARFVVAVGMLATMLTSFILREPFATQYMRAEPDLLGARRISAAWAGAFALMSAADAGALYLRATTPEWAVLAVNLAALAGATIFTLRLAAATRRARPQ